MVVSLLVELARTAVAFFNTDLLLAVALGLLRARRKVAADRDRSVLSFRSGLGLLGLLDLELLVSLGGLGLALLVGGGEDAEGDGDASLKVQIGDLSGAERTILLQRPSVARERKEDERRSSSCFAS